MALPGFIRFSVSASKMKGIRNTPLFQLLQSMSAAPAANKKNLEVFYEKFGNLKNAAKAYKYCSKNYNASDDLSEWHSLPKQNHACNKGKN